MATSSLLAPGDHTFSPSNAPSLKLHYAVISTTNSSPPSPPRYLIIHPPPWGIGHSIYTSSPQFLDPLLKHFTIITLTSRGTPPSTRPPSPSQMSSSTIIADLDAFRQHIGLSKINLFGHSSGATITLGYALRYPQHIDRVIACCPLILTNPNNTTSSSSDDHESSSSPFNPEFAAAAAAAAKKLFPSIESGPDIPFFQSSPSDSLEQVKDNDFFTSFIKAAYADHPPRSNADFNDYMVEMAPVYLSPATRARCTAATKDMFARLKPEGLPDQWCWATYYGCDVREGWDQMEDIKKVFGGEGRSQVSGKVLFVPGRDDPACEASICEKVVEMVGGKGNGRMEVQVIEEAGHSLVGAGGEVESGDCAVFDGRELRKMMMGSN